MERHPNRESVIGLYSRDRLGTDKVRIAENSSALVMAPEFLSLGEADLHASGVFLQGCKPAA